MGNFLTFITLLAAAAFAIFGYFSYIHADDNATKAVYAGIGITALGALVYTGYGIIKGRSMLMASPFWRRLRGIPKAPRNRLGIAIGITAETEDQIPQLTHDFIDDLKRRAQQGKLANLVSIVLMPPGACPEDISKPEAVRLVRKMRCVLLITVYARVRNVKGEAHHVLDIHTGALHDQIDDRIRAFFVREMKDLLAHRRHISKANDLEEFEWNAASVHLAALYIIAASAILSNSPDVALILLGELKEQLPLVNTAQPPTVRKTLQQLRRRLPIYMAVAHLQSSQILHAGWRKTRDVSLIDGMAQHLEVAGRLLPDMPEVWIGWALFHAVKHRDMREARAWVKKFKAARISNPLWRFNMGFTYAYEGNMAQATQLYMSACAMKPPAETVLEVEEFILWMLGEEPDKIQLHFILGLINQHGKRDPEAATRHYKTFLSQAGDSQFPEQREQARRFLEEPA